MCVCVCVCVWVCVRVCGWVSGCVYMCACVCVLGYDRMCMLVHVRVVSRVHNIEKVSNAR